MANALKTMTSGKNFLFMILIMTFFYSHFSAQDKKEEKVKQTRLNQNTKKK